MAVGQPSWTFLGCVSDPRNNPGVAPVGMTDTSALGPFQVAVGLFYNQAAEEYYLMLAAGPLIGQGFAEIFVKAKLGVGTP